MDTSRLDLLIARVREKLNANGFGSQAELAEHLDVAPHHVTPWLTRKREPNAENALALQEWLKLRARRCSVPKAKP